MIQWQEESGFGVSSSPEHGYGEAADEIYQDQEAAYARTVSLLLSSSFTAPPPLVRLRDLRRERGLSQTELAARLDTQQASVSKLERRGDMLISSVREVVQSMGGVLRVTAAFPDGTERSLEFEDETSSRRRIKARNS